MYEKVEICGWPLSTTLLKMYQNCSFQTTLAYHLSRQCQTKIKTRKATHYTNKMIDQSNAPIQYFFYKRMSVGKS